MARFMAIYLTKLPTRWLLVEVVLKIAVENWKKTHECLWQSSLSSSPVAACSNLFDETKAKKELPPTGGCIFN